MGRNRVSDLAPLPELHKNTKTAASSPAETPDTYRRPPTQGQALVQASLVIPKIAEQQIDVADPEFLKNLDMVREGSLVWIRPESDRVLVIEARSKPRLQSGIDALINLMIKRSPPIEGDYAFHLAQIPASLRDSVKIRYLDHGQIHPFGQDKSYQGWRAITTESPAVNEDVDDGSPLPADFENYVDNFQQYFSQVAARFQTVPHQIRMAINLGTLLQLPSKPLNKKQLDFEKYETDLEKAVQRGKYCFQKEIGNIALARKIRQSVEASPKDFMPSDHRVQELSKVPAITSVILFTKHFRLEMQLQDLAVNVHLAAPTAFKQVSQNKEVAIVSANPGGAYDWDLEILVEEASDQIPINYAKINRQIKIAIERDGTVRPMISQQLMNAAEVTKVCTRSARKYIVDDDYEFEVALLTTWGQTDVPLSRVCHASLCSVDWADQLDSRNIAVNPRDLGPDGSRLLDGSGPAGQGAARLLKVIFKMQQFMDRVKAGYHEPDQSSPAHEESLMPGID